jgi:hypothetical protein
MAHVLPKFHEMPCAKYGNEVQRLNAGWRIIGTPFVIFRIEVCMD